MSDGWSTEASLSDYNGNNNHNLKSWIEIFQIYVRKIEVYLTGLPIITLLAEKSGFRPIIVVIVSLAVLVSSVIDGWGLSLVANIIGLAYPAWMTFKVIEGPVDIKQKVWLIYWFIFALFIFFESFFGWFLSFIPSYGILKIVFLLWLMLPNFQGASVVYKKFVRKILVQHMIEIQAGFEYAEGILRNTMGVIRSSTTGSIDYSS